jgi:AcrR family transcriptional regulator
MRLVSQIWIGASYGPDFIIHKPLMAEKSPVDTRMTRPRHPLSEPPVAPERGVKAATFHLLLDTAMALIHANGHIPSVADVALHCKVSRATAYRYFPSRSALITAVVDSSLGPVRNLSSDNPDGRARVRELFTETFPRFKEFEPQLRAAAQLSMEQWALERAGQLDEAPYRRGHRIRILEHAIAPLPLKPAVRKRLHKALSVVYGIEPFVILKDIWGLPDREVEGIALWMADALIEAAMREEAAAPARPAAASKPAALPKPNARQPTAQPKALARSPRRKLSLPSAGK